MPTLALYHAVYTLLLFLLAVSHHATAKDKALELLPNYTTPTAELHITVNKLVATIGETVEFSFTSTQDGYVTLWDIGTSGRAVRLYPNRHGGTMCVRAGQPYGAGGPGDSFKFQVNGPVGMEDVYAI